ncbi:MAG: radical SAM family heme chaperone HemW [Gammaproteobacteria bacterium]
MLELPPLAVYVHLPWCVRKCPYCDFNSHALPPATVAAAPDAAAAARLPEAQERAYLEALLTDLRQDLPLVEGLPGREVVSVFLGGGTPSLFSAEGIAWLLRGLRDELPLAADCEVTLEANPGTLERGRFAGYREAGVNRVSVGAQTFSAARLQALGRIHGPDDTRRAVAELHAAGLPNHNLDLMYALPDQGTTAALADVEAALALDPPHLSYYQLTLEPGTVFHHRPPAGLPDEDAALALEAATHARLLAAGFRRYEVSAWSRPGRECRHNLNYWTFGDYLGLGAGAHGKLTQASRGEILRTLKLKQPREYQANLPAARTLEPVAPRDRPFEYLLNALRLADGFSEAGFVARTGLPWGTVAGRVERLAATGGLEPCAVAEGPGWRPTPRGYALLNTLIEAFLPSD